MSEQPLERLNYYNGQRLEAEDFRLEQQYHMRVQQWLSRSLFTPGVAAGLEVTVVDPERTSVTISPGMALDTYGRTIILPDYHEEPGPGSDFTGSFYLTVCYAETVETPSRRRAAPQFAWRKKDSALSNEELVLATLSFQAQSSCKLSTPTADNVLYATIRNVVPIQTYALEGFRDIDKNNPGKIYFHVRGRRPERVTLYLRPERFPTLFYTELGTHTHSSSFSDTGKDSEGQDQSHHHIMTDDSRTYSYQQNENVPSNHFHEHGVAGRGSGYNPSGTIPIGGENPPVQAIEMVQIPKLQAFPANIGTAHEESPQYIHVHSLKNAQTSNQTGDHKHKVKGDIFSIGTGTGAKSITARTTNNAEALAYVTNLQITIDGKDQTAAILRQLQETQPTNNWISLSVTQGQNNPFSSLGTGSIRIDLLAGILFDEGEHRIDLVVSGDNNGGRIHYNLYVE